MTNQEWIQSMSGNALSHLLGDVIACECCPALNSGCAACANSCYQSILDWLEAEHEE